MRKNVFLVIFSVLLCAQAHSQEIYRGTTYEYINGAFYTINYECEILGNFVVGGTARVEINCANVKNGQLDIDIPRYINCFISAGGSNLQASLPTYVYFRSGNCEITTIKIGQNYSGDFYEMFGWGTANRLDGLANLTSIEVAEGNLTYSSEDGILYNRNKTSLLCYPAKKIGDNFVIPGTVTKIDSYAFENCINLTSVNIPSSVTNIHDFAFQLHPNLISIEVAEGNKNYSSENGVLYNSDKTALRHYPQGKLDKNFIIPAMVKDVWIMRSPNLISITIPPSVSYLSNNFSGYGCPNLTSIEVLAGNKNYSSEDGILYNSDKTTLLCYPASKTGESFVIPETVTIIGNGAFMYCANLTSLYIPESVTAIRFGAIESCAKLTSIINLNPVPLNIADLETFKYVDKSACTLYVPVGSKENYQNARVWKDFKNIVELPANNENPCQELEENTDPNYTYRYFLWGGKESPTKPAKGVNHYRVTFYKGNPTALDKYKCN
ncbi:MAG: leucine-rich repeat domain-containing protein [Bacteroidetes bacterium]|nr:leucine-rich repeat domain-containing protein [Bacteroidota bacterium]